MFVLAAGAAVLAFAGVAGAGGGANNVKNGNFETSDFSGWNWDCSTCDGAWLVSKQKATPSGFSWFGPMQGDYSALADEGLPDTLYLWQTFKIGKPNAKLTFVADWNNRSANGWCNLILDFDLGDSCTGFNQQFRIDILADGASPDTTDPGDILKTIFQTQDNTPLQQPKISFSVKLGNGIKGKVTFRVVVVAGDYVLNVGIDKVNINNGG
jgi:hypothetical protein